MKNREGLLFEVEKEGMMQRKIGETQKQIHLNKEVEKKLASKKIVHRMDQFVKQWDSRVRVLEKSRCEQNNDNFQYKNQRVDTR